jgi:hypothetical protein
MLRNIRTTERTMNIKCNAGVTRMNLIGDLPGYGEVWYNPQDIANILSLSKVEAQHHITYDSATDDGFVVHKLTENLVNSRSPEMGSSISM